MEVLWIDQVHFEDIADGRIVIHPPEVFGHGVRIYPLEATVGEMLHRPAIEIVDVVVLEVAGR